MIQDIKDSIQQEGDRSSRWYHHIADEVTGWSAASLGVDEEVTTLLLTGRTEMALAVILMFCIKRIVLLS